MEILSGTLLPAKDAPPSPVLTSQLEVGKILTGRVAQVEANGRGTLRFPSGMGFSFANTSALKLGEPVQVQVLRLVPEVAFRVLVSASGIAAGLAESAEQSLVRAPDIFANLLNWSGLSKGGSPVASGEGGAEAAGGFLFSLKSGLQAGTLTARQGLTLLHALKKTLPNLSAKGLLRGEIKELVRLLETGSRQDVRQMIHQLRQVSAGLFRASGGGAEHQVPGQGGVVPGEEAAELNAVRNTLHRLGDLLAMQEILPRTALSPEGGQLLGYRLFWLTEGGMGEAIWQRERSRKKGAGDEDADSAITTVLLSLNMTDLGVVQARLTYGEGQCAVRIAAEEARSLAALRGRISELRQSLLAAELPLRSLDLFRLVPGEVREERMRTLGLASHFSTEA